MKQPAFALFLLALAACVPASTINVTATDTLVSTVAYLSTTTEVPSQTPSPSPTTTTEPTPGPDLAVLYIDQGQIKRIDLRSWKEDVLPLSNTIQFAALSPDGQKLAYGDETGIYLSMHPFVTANKINGTSEININNGDRSLLFNHDSNLLAISDVEGLKLIDLSDDHSKLITKNNIYYNEIYDYLNNLPAAWSPDSRYLWVDVGIMEGSASIIADVVRNTISDYLFCYSEVAWLTESTLLGTVHYSGRESCGFEPGVFHISVKGRNYEETRIYSDKVNPPEYQSFSALSLSPSNKDVSFFEHLGENNDTYHHYLMDSGGKNVREIVKPEVVENYSMDTFWSSSGQEMYLYSDHEVYVYSLETREWTSLYKNTDTKIKIDAISPDGKWLFLNNGTLLSTETGEAISLENNIPEDQEQVFVGWLENK